MRANAIGAVVVVSAACAAACSFGAGAQAGISRDGPSVGVLLGGGPGGRWAGVKAQIGVMVESGGEGAYPIAGATGYLYANPQSQYTGGGEASFFGARDGVHYAAGITGVRWANDRDAADCRERGWTVTIGVRRARGKRTELFVWPEFVAYSQADC